MFAPGFDMHRSRIRRNEPYHKPGENTQITKHVAILVSPIGSFQFVILLYMCVISVVHLIYRYMYQQQQNIGER